LNNVNLGVNPFESYKRNGALNARVLLLNQSYEPLSVTNVKKAIILILLRKAELVADKENKKIHSVNAEFKWPTVIRLKSYIHVPYKNIILTRKNILKRDGHRCAYCGRGDLPLTIDHIIPKSRGGEDSWENMVASCLSCNNRKGNRTPEEANMKLRVKPFEPNHISFIRNCFGRIDHSWEPFLFH